MRHRLDAQARRRYTTVELIVDHGPMAPRPDRLVGVRIRFEETELRNQVKQHGAVWDRNVGVWRMPYRTASGLGLKARIVET